MWKKRAFTKEGLLIELNSIAPAKLNGSKSITASIISIIPHSEVSLKKIPPNVLKNTVNLLKHINLKNSKEHL